MRIQPWKMQHLQPSPCPRWTVFKIRNVTP
jgi:hypothetical protein